MIPPERHSIAGQPHPQDKEIDWSQVGETLAMLALAVAQIDTSLTEGTQSVDRLSSSFTAMAENTRRILAISNHEVEAEHITAREIRNEIRHIATDVSDEIHQAIVAFQFYDRLSQRLEHVSQSLERVGHLMADPSQRYQPRYWKELQNKIKSQYTMEAERIMFEHIMAGNSVAQALEIYHHHFQRSANDSFDTTDEIELF